MMTDSWLQHWEADGGPTEAASVMERELATDHYGPDCLLCGFTCLNSFNPQLF